MVTERQRRRRSRPRGLHRRKRCVIDQPGPPYSFGQSGAHPFCGGSVPQQHLLLGQVGLRIGNAHFLRIVSAMKVALRRETPRSRWKVQLHGSSVTISRRTGVFPTRTSGGARLLVEQPVGFRPRWRHQEIRIIEGTGPSASIRRWRPIQCRRQVDNGMGDVDVFWDPTRAPCRRRPTDKNFTRRPHGAPPTQACRRTGEEDIALAPGQHQPRRFAAGEKG